MANIAEISIWLADHKRIGMPLGIEVSVDDDKAEYTIVFAGLITGDEMAFHGKPGDAGIKALTRLLDSRDYFKLVPYSIPEMSGLLWYLTGLDPAKVLLPHFVGDAETIEYTIGRVHVADDNLIDEARRNLTDWRAVQQMEMPAYYRTIAEPLARLMAVPPLEASWRVDYPDLLLRVITKYSDDPMLLQAIIDEEFPVQARVTRRLQEIYDTADHDMAYAAIMWAALGGDSAHMAAVYPERFIHLNGLDMNALGHNLDKVIPSVRLMATSLWSATVQTLGPAQVFRTFYGRMMPYFPDPRSVSGPGPYLDHVLCGTVNDIKNVFAVSAANLGATTVEVPLIRGDEDTISVIGSHSGDVYEFLNQLKTLAVLGKPLLPVPLHPIITDVRRTRA